MIKTLLIYNFVSEDSNFYVIPDSELTAEHVRLLSLAHGKLTNLDEDNEGLEFAMNALAAEPELCSDCPEEWKCCLHRYKVEQFDGIGPFSRVFYTGFAI